MKDPESRTIFAGVDGRTDTELPEWYRQRRGGDDAVTFAEAIRDLPQAVETTVAYQNPYTVECAPLPSDFGIDLPAPLLVGTYASGSRYPLLPWSDGLVCSCPYKHDRPWRVLCKHELLAAIVAGGVDSIFLPVTRGLDVPHRARRFVSPAIAGQHTSQSASNSSI